MNKELNIGDYVRFDYHRVTVPILIGKIVHIEYDEVEKYYSYVTDNGLVIGNENIIKRSPNIIDLLEKGDLIKLKDVKHYQEVEAIDDDKLYLTEYIYLSGLQKYKKEIEKDLEWVITHEQLNEIKYEVNK